MQARYDCHIHTLFSSDSHSPMEAMAQAAVERGLKGITITDHYHPDYPDPVHRTGQPPAAYHRAMEEVGEEFRGRLEVLRGLEVGVLLGATLPTCQAAAAAYPYDFLLAAFHSTATETFDGLGRSGALPQRDLYLLYYRHVLDCVKNFKDYDALAHINLIDRYGGILTDYSACLPLLDDIFTTAIADGKGLEVNTSSFRYGMGSRTTPTLEMLRRYRALGGEIVTVGSDAHEPAWVGSHLEDGYELLRAAGWRYYAVYHHRKPEFLPL